MSWREEKRKFIETNGIYFFEQGLIWMIPSNEPYEKLEEDEAPHLPDIRFVAYCYRTFGLNRGIYNTIDQWLYDFGCKDIIERRTVTIHFLKEIEKRHGWERGGPILRFGKGGLTQQLYDFIRPPHSAAPCE